MHILIIWSWTREHCIAWKLAQSKQNPTISCFGSHKNPWILPTCKHYQVGTITNTEEVVQFANKIGATLAVIWPEAPLATGVADALRDSVIPTVGPRKQLAQLETSKAFTRNLLTKYNISTWSADRNVSPAFQYFQSMEGIEEFITDQCYGSFVIKHDGLKGGKGVLVMGDHFEMLQEWLTICQQIIDEGDAFLIEEKIVGQEFSLISFCDGKSLAHTPVVQDHKRAYEGDTGPNTWGMGTYSDANHLLPFLTMQDVLDAQQINKQVLRALQQEFNQPYQGIMYGGFMVTAHGIKVIEYNARFGDPEVFNLLTLLETDLVEVCQAITKQTLDQVTISFKQQASVCKYLVPQWYPSDPIKGAEINMGDVPTGIDYFFGSLDQQNDKLLTLWSRAIALIAHGDTIEQAEQDVEVATTAFSWPLEHRKDIGTKALLDERVAMMKDIRNWKK